MRLSFSQERIAQRQIYRASTKIKDIYPKSTTLDKYLLISGIVDQEFFYDILNFRRGTKYFKVT